MSILIPNENELENLDEVEDANAIVPGPPGSFENASLSNLSSNESQKIQSKSLNDDSLRSGASSQQSYNKDSSLQYTSNPNSKNSSPVISDSGITSLPFSPGKHSGMNLLPPPNLALLGSASNKKRVSQANILPSPVPKPSYSKDKPVVKDNERLKITDELVSSDDLLLETPTDDMPQGFDFNFSSESLTTNVNLDSGSYLNSGLDSSLGLESGNIIQYTPSGFFTIPDAVLSGPISLRETAMPNLSDVFLSRDIMAPMLIDGSESQLPPKCCEYCSRPIQKDGVFVDSCYYHKECMVCTICGNSSPNMISFRNKICCSDCINKITNDSICFGCGFLILMDGITVCGHRYHCECVSCGFCRKRINAPKSATQIGEVLACEDCLPKIENRKCRGCGEVVTDNFVKHSKMYFHVEHFRCCMCNELLIGRNFVCHHNRFFCPKHGAPFYENCAICKRRFLGPTEDRVLWAGKMYHPSCFGCRICGKSLKPSRAIRSIYGRPHCRQCYSERCKEGDVGDTGKRAKKVHHNPGVAKSRRTKLQQILHVDPPYEPEYISEPTVEHAKKIKQKYAPDIDNMTRYVQ